MPSKQHNPPLSDGVPERDSRVVRCYAEHLKGSGLSAGKTRILISTAKHITVWLAINGQGLDTFDIRLLDGFMRHECHCPSRHRPGRRPGPRCRSFAIRFLRYLLEAGLAEVPPEIEAGEHLATLFRGFLEERGYPTRRTRLRTCASNAISATIRRAASVRSLTNRRHVTPSHCCHAKSFEAAPPGLHRLCFALVPRRPTGNGAMPAAECLVKMICRTRVPRRTPPNCTFLMRRIENVRGELSLITLAYDMPRRAINLDGVPTLVAAARLISASPA